MNISLRKDKHKRKEVGLVIKEKDRPRNVLTELGEIKFSRDYYFNTKTGEYETPLDQMMSIEQRSRIGGVISAKLSTKATTESYERSTQDVTGGLVSHVLSERFSRNPMGWSEEGVGKLSKLRVFCKNGGEIEAEHFRSSYSENENYKEYADRYVADFVKNCDFSWINDLRENNIFDTSSGTQQAIKMIARCRTDILC